MSTICAIRRTYHIVNPNDRRLRKGERKKDYDGYYRATDPSKMSNNSLRNHLCEPWYGCHKCEDEHCVCMIGAEYLRRERAGEIEKLQLWEAVT